MTDLKDLARLLDERGIDGRCAADFSLARFTTYRLGGPAGLYVEAGSKKDLEILGRVLRDNGCEDVPLLVLGRGSNLVISDSGWAGIVVRLGAAFSWARPFGDAGVHAGSSMSMPQLANFSARRGLAGLEWAISIPGSVGGGVRMNAGAHGGEMKDHLVAVEVWNAESLAFQERVAADLDMTYRRTNLKPTEVVLEARFDLESQDEEAIRARMESYRKHRAATQPGAVQNAGSVFKNPAGNSAGRLVEAAGLKGFRVGGARVSELHANFFIAEDGARAQDVFDLVSAVKTKVMASSGVELQTEIRFVGEFAETGEEG